MVHFSANIYKLALKADEEFLEEMQKLSEQEDQQTALELQKLADREQQKQDLIKEQEEILKALETVKNEDELLELERKLQLTNAILEDHNVDSLDALIQFRRAKAAANDRFDKAENEKIIKQQKERLNKQAQFYASVGSVIGSTIDALGDKASENTALGKTLALTQIAVSSAEAIAKGTAAAAGVPFPGNLAAIATTVATVLANIASAKKIISATAQKKFGGWHNVVGPDDGQHYRAKYIGAPTSGMLPSHPVVLASEAGAEYFVSHRDLQNPYVLDHVRAIENVRGQYQEGGPTAELPQSSATPQQQEQENLNLEIQKMTLDVLLELQESLQNLHAKIDDETALDISKRIRELNAASGGTIGI